MFARLPVKLGNVIAATTPIIVNDSNISAIVKAKILLGFNCGSRSVTDSVVFRLSNSVQRLTIVAEFVRSLHSRSSRNGGIVVLACLSHCRVPTRYRFDVRPAPRVKRRRSRLRSNRGLPVARSTLHLLSQVSRLSSACPPPPDQNAHSTRVFSF